MATLKNLAIASFILVILISCYGQSTVDATKIKAYQKEVVDSNSNSILTIVKVKKPWYAWRGLIIKKMKESIPQYQAASGLKQKFFSFTEDHKLFGGIYQWQSEKEAKDWFNNAWYERTEKKYGKKGLVDFYKIVRQTNFTDMHSQNGEYWCVFTYSSTISNLNISTQGIIKQIFLRNSLNEFCYLTFWENKKVAQNFFKDKNLKNEYFDIPIIINNVK